MPHPEQEQRSCKSSETTLRHIGTGYLPQTWQVQPLILNLQETTTLCPVQTILSF